MLAPDKRGQQRGVADNETHASTDLVLSCHAPQLLAAAYRLVQDPSGTANERLGRRLGFVDTTLRFVVAVLASDAFAQGLALPDEYSKLVRKLEAPSWGDWNKAAEALACDLLAVDCAAPDFASLFWTRGANGPERTEFAKTLTHFVDRRNSIFHREVPVPSETQAALLNQEDDAPLRRVMGALQFVRRFAFLFVVERHEREDGSSCDEVLRLSGNEPERVRSASGGALARVPKKQPFLLARTGRVLLLSPFIRVEQEPGSGRLDMLLLARWRAEGFDYSSARRHDRVHHSPRDGELARRPEDLTTLPSRRAEVPPHIAQELLAAGEDDVHLPGFILEGVIGRGASGVVYRARERLLDRPPGAAVAIKVLHPQVTHEPLQRERLKREHDVLARLQSPGIVKVHRYAEEPRPHIVMEYVAGEDLRSLVEQRPLRPDDAGRICLDVLEALAVAHRAGIVHRDVKPSNVMRDEQGRIRIVDFGIALADALAPLTRTFDALGTFDFAAPEQMVRGAQVDRRADLYSVGRLLEFLVTGKLGPACEVSPTIPAGLSAVVHRATHRRPEDRFATCDEMRSVLHQRMSARWEGAPVEAGDRVGDSFDLVKLCGHRDGIWAFEATEVATSDRVTLLLARRGRNDEGSARLVQAVRALPLTLRSLLGSPRINSDGALLHYTVLPLPDPAEVLNALLESRQPRALPASDLPEVPPTVPGQRGEGLASASEGERVLVVEHGAHVEPTVRQASEGRVEPIVNRFVDYLNTLRTQSDRGNAFCFHEARGQTSSLGKFGLSSVETHVPTRLDRLVEDALAPNFPFRAILLTGDAGDGKTACCGRLATQLAGGSLSDEARAAPRLELGGWVILKDGSELNSVTDSQRSLDRIIGDEIPRSSARFLLAINEGRLRRACQTARPRTLWEGGVEAALLAREGSATQVERAERAMVDSKVLVLNLRDRCLPADLDTFRQIVDAMTRSDRWEEGPCRTCPALPRCHIAANARALRGPAVRRLRELLLAAYDGGQALPFRRLQGLLAYAITAGFSCTERTAGEAAVQSQAYHEEPNLALRARYYNTLLGHAPAQSEAMRAEPICRFLQLADPGVVASPECDRLLSGIPENAEFEATFGTGWTEVERAGLRELRTTQRGDFVRALKRKAFFELAEAPIGPPGLPTSLARYARRFPFESFPLYDRAVTSGSDEALRDAERRIIEGLNGLDGADGQILQTDQLDPIELTHGSRFGLRFRLQTAPETRVSALPPPPVSARRYLEHRPGALMLHVTRQGTEVVRLRVDLGLFELLDAVAQGFRAPQAFGTQLLDIRRFKERLIGACRGSSADLALSHHGKRYRVRLTERGFDVDAEGAGEGRA